MALASPDNGTSESVGDSKPQDVFFQVLGYFVKTLRRCGLQDVAEQQSRATQDSFSALPVSLAGRLGTRN